jgi:hypothetical protein
MCTSETVGQGPYASHRTARRVLRTELEIRGLLHRLGALLVVIHDELSLLPVCGPRFFNSLITQTTDAETYTSI